MRFTYRGLQAELRRHMVTEAEIEQQMQQLCQQTPRVLPVEDRASQLGDEVLLDYAGFCDGVQFPGGTARMQTLVLGSGSFIPGFEEQLVDKMPGDEVTVKVMFPTQYHAQELAGKAAEFRCKIHQIRVKSSYALDDTFAKEVGGCETMEQMRAKMGASLQAYADDNAEMALQDRLMRQAADTLAFQASEKQVEDEMDQQLNNLKAQLAQQGMSLDMYCQFLSTTVETLREETRARAEESVKIQAAIEQVVYLENLEATQAEIAEAMEVIARQNRMTVEQLKPYCDEAFQAAVVRSVLTSKVLKLIRDTAVITETTE